MSFLSQKILLVDFLLLFVFGDSGGGRGKTSKNQPTNSICCFFGGRGQKYNKKNSLKQPKKKKKTYLKRVSHHVCVYLRQPLQQQVPRVPDISVPLIQMFLHVLGIIFVSIILLSEKKNKTEQTKQIKQQIFFHPKEQI